MNTGYKVIQFTPTLTNTFGAKIKDISYHSSFVPTTNRLLISCIEIASIGSSNQGSLNGASNGHIVGSFSVHPTTYSADSQPCFLGENAFALNRMCFMVMNHDFNMTTLTDADQFQIGFETYHCCNPNHSHDRH
jgi:hypothetical protein